jgi:hypothetical protein
MSVAGIVQQVSGYDHLTRRHRHGKDRPGLVEAPSEALAAHHGNWLESRIAGLGGRFAAICWRASWKPRHAP